MESSARPRPVRSTIAALMATVFTAVAIAPADADSDSPFGDAPRLADAALDTMRGGFSVADGSILRFAVNLQTVVDGQPIASLTIGNDSQGRIFASSQNLGSTVALPGDGSFLVTNTLAQATGTTTVTTQNGSSLVTVQVAPPTTSGATGSGPSPVVVTTTLTPALPASLPAGAILATTGLLPNGNGVVTLIQNTRSNAVISAVENLNIQLSGVGNAVLRANTAFHSFANAMRFSVHR
jgi:hypothetical protein